MENSSQEDENAILNRDVNNGGDHSPSDHSTDSDLESLTQRESTTILEPSSPVQVQSSSDADSDSTIIVKYSDDGESSCEDIFEKPVPGKKCKKLESSNGNQQGPSSAGDVPSTSAKRTYDAMRNDREEEEQNCPICLDMWSSEGGHRLCSLKCGHLFGKSCIFNWLVKQKKNCCPQCNKKASSFDIRELFATKLVALDCSEKIRLEHEIEIVREEKRQVEIELAKCRLYAESFKLEVNKLQKELAKFTGKTDNSLIKKNNFKFHLEKTIQIADGSCRVCIYDPNKQMLLVCHQSKNQLFPGFGIKKIHNLGTDYIGNNFLHLHSKTIRDIRFHPLMPNVILTVGFDKCAKICDLEKQSVNQTFVSDYALWSCCWDEEDPNFFYVGTGKGTVHVFDVRSPGEPITEMKLFGDTSSVVSICYVPSKPDIPRGGIICCRLNSVVFYKKETSKEFTSFRFNNLVGPFFSLISDPSTGHVLISSRPSTAVANVRHLFCELDGDKCQPIHVFVGGTVQSMLSRPCFVKIDKETLVAVFQESNSSIELWSTATGLKVSSIRVREEIYDVASMTIGERHFLAFISSSAVRFYESS